MRLLRGPRKACSILLRGRSFKLLFLAYKWGLGSFCEELLVQGYKFQLRGDVAMVRDPSGALVANEIPAVVAPLVGLFHQRGARFVPATTSGTVGEKAGNSPQVTLNRLMISPTTITDYWIFYEVMIRGDYDALGVAGKIVIDVGANTGITMLYFLKEKGAKKVFGFEPFPSSVAKAQKNLRLNGVTEAEATLFPVGLGGSERELEVEYDELFPGNMATSGEFLDAWRSALGPAALRRLRKERVRIVDFELVVGKLMAENTGETFVLKMDCEGSEFEIFEALRSRRSNVLSRFDEMLVEYHQKDYTEIQAWLSREFHVEVRDEIREGKRYSMLHAWRRATPHGL